MELLLRSKSEDFEDFQQCVVMLSREFSDGRLKKLHDEVFKFQRQLSETEGCKNAVL
jgi:hypothetical protein